jgi:hypothetical protein
MEPINIKSTEGCKMETAADLASFFEQDEGDPPRRSFTDNILLQPRPIACYGVWVDMDASVGPLLSMLNAVGTPNPLSPDNDEYVDDKHADKSWKERPSPKSRPHQYKNDQWDARFRDLLEFRDQFGHVNVPHSYPPNQKLAKWTKR